MARDGGYIMDASAIVQNDATVENMRAMTEFTREYGVYSDGHCSRKCLSASRPLGADWKTAMPPVGPGATPPGVCCPWHDKRKQLPELSGDVQLLQNVWEGVDALANVYIWQLLLSF